MTARPWKLEDNRSSIGRVLNELRRNLQFANIEVDRLRKLDDSLDTVFFALKNETAQLEIELEELEKELKRLFNLAEDGKTRLNSDEPIDQESLLPWSAKLDENFGHWKKLVNLATRIKVFSENVPCSLHLYLHQKSDAKLSKNLKIPELLASEILAGLGLTPNVITIIGENFQILHLRGINSKDDQYILWIPLSRYNDILGWIPIGHEIGHLFLNTLNVAFLRLRILMIAEEYVPSQLDSDLVWNWFREVFADIVMTDFFLGGSIYEINALLGLEIIKVLRFDVLESLMEFSRGGERLVTNEELQKLLKQLQQKPSPISSTHPPLLLRIKLMCDFMKIRTGEQDIPHSIWNNFAQSYEITKDFIPEIWRNEEFQQKIVDVILGELSEISIDFTFVKQSEVLTALREKDNLNRFKIYEILSGLSTYLSLGNPSIVDDMIDWVHTTLRDRAGI